MNTEMQQLEDRIYGIYGCLLENKDLDTRKRIYDLLLPCLMYYV